MTQGDFGILLAAVGIVLTVVLGLAALRRRRAAPHWTPPGWTVGAMKVGTQRLPVATIRWTVRGEGEAQGVECAVRSPSGSWQRCASPSGRLQLPKSDLCAYVNLVDGQPFNTTIASPAGIRAPVTD